MPLSPDKIVDKQLTQFFKRIHSVQRYLVELHSCWPFKGGRKDLTHNFIWNPLKVHCSLKGSNMIKGSRVLSYESKEGILNLVGKGWLLMEAMKGESVQWTKSSTGFAILMFSLILSMTFFIWSISLSKCGTLHEAVPLDWFSGSAFSPSLTSWL